MRSKAAFFTASLIALGSTTPGPANSTDQQSAQEKLSLIEAAPFLYSTAKRMHKFFGDDDTVYGNLSERNFVLGFEDGLRRDMMDNGLFIDFGVTQFVQDNLDGGADDSADIRTNGSSDLWLWYDTGKAGWWGGGAFFSHAETKWGTGINKDVGSFLPANFDESLPSADSPDSALSELYYLQALPHNLTFAAGKMAISAWADGNLFANNERTQFTYQGLYSNPADGVFFPYTSIAAWLNWTPNKHHSLIFAWGQATGNAGSSGLDNFNGDYSYAVEYIYSTDINNKPGNYLIAALYSRKDIPAFDNPGEEKSDNYGIIGNFGQYLWMPPESAAAFLNRPHSARARHTAPPVGAGIFVRFGFTPEDRNSFDNFYSAGFGGYGILIPGRNYDNWGIGFAGTRTSSDFRDLNPALETWEHAYEIFYNFAITPAIRLSFNARSINTATKDLDTSYSLTSRLQIDF